MFERIKQDREGDPEHALLANLEMLGDVFEREMNDLLAALRREAVPVNDGEHSFTVARMKPFQGSADNPTIIDYVGVSGHNGFILKTNQKPFSLVLLSTESFVPLFISYRDSFSLVAIRSGTASGYVLQRAIELVDQGKEARDFQIE